MLTLFSDTAVVVTEGKRAWIFNGRLRMNEKNANVRTACPSVDRRDEGYEQFSTLSIKEAL
jgi:hypothetical protein